MVGSVCKVATIWKDSPHQAPGQASSFLKQADGLGRNEWGWGDIFGSLMWFLDKQAFIHWPSKKKSVKVQCFFTNFAKSLSREPDLPLAGPDAPYSQIHFIFSPLPSSMREAGKRRSKKWPLDGDIKSKITSVSKKKRCHKFGVATSASWKINLKQTSGYLKKSVVVQFF